MNFFFSLIVVLLGGYVLCMALFNKRPKYPHKFAFDKKMNWDHFGRYVTGFAGFIFLVGGLGGLFVQIGEEVPRYGFAYFENVNDCGQPQEALREEDGWFYGVNGVGTPVFYAELDSQDDVFEVVWRVDPSHGAGEPPVVLGTDVPDVQLCEDGSMYINSFMPSDHDMGPILIFAPSWVDFYLNDVLVFEGYLSLVQ